MSSQLRLQSIFDLGLAGHVIMQRCMGILKKIMDLQESKAREAGPLLYVGRAGGLGQRHTPQQSQQRLPQHDAATWCQFGDLQSICGLRCGCPKTCGDHSNPTLWDSGVDECLPHLDSVVVVGRYSKMLWLSLKPIMDS